MAAENLHHKTAIRTFTGKYINPLDPDPEMICIEDIAHALSNICRFGGHSRRFYSVAQHSVIVSQLVPEREQLAALLHDAAEAYLMDIPRPIKHQIPQYIVAEQNLFKAISEKFKIPAQQSQAIKEADNATLKKEWESIVVKSFTIDPITPKHPIDAKQQFLKAYNKYTKYEQ